MPLTPTQRHRGWKMTAATCLAAGLLVVGPAALATTPAAAAPGGPTVTVEQAAGQADPTNTAPVLFTATFSADINQATFDGTDVELGGSAGATTAAVSGGPQVFTIAVSGMTGSGTVTATIPEDAVLDLAGTGNVASTSVDNTVVYDATGPVVTVEKAAGQADPTNTSPIQFVIDVSEPVVGYNGLVDIDVTGPWSGLSLSSSGFPTTLTIVPSGDGTLTVTVPAGAFTDAAGNPNTVSVSIDDSVDYDTTGPTVTVEQAADQADPANGDTVIFTVEFSEDVNGFGDTDVVLGGTAGATAAVVSGSGSSYEVAISGMTGSGTVTASVPAGAAADTAGNPSEASTSTDNEVTLDVGPPTVILEQAAGQADPTSTTPIAFTAVFSEAVTEFTELDVQVSGSAGATTVDVAGGPTEYTISISGMAGDGEVTVAIPAGAAVDAAGNPSTAAVSTDPTVVYDATGPTVTVSPAAGQAATTDATPVVFTITFDEPAPGLTVDDLIVAGTADPTTVALTGGPSVYTATIGSVERPGAITLGVDAGVTTDALGNPNPASNVATVTIADTTGPIITTPAGGITVANDPREPGAVVTYTVTAQDPDSSGNTLTEAFGTTPTVSCTPASGSFFTTGNTTVTCTATDPAGNTTTAVFTVTVVDTEAPTLDISDGQNITLPPGTNRYTVPTVTDNAGATTVTCIPGPDTALPVGTTTITCTATDGSGNTSTASFAVTVQPTPVELPATGSHATPWLSTALTLLALGAIALGIAHRRRVT